VDVRRDWHSSPSEVEQLRFVLLSALQSGCEHTCMCVAGMIVGLVADRLFSGVTEGASTVSVAAAHAATLSTPRGFRPSTATKYSSVRVAPARLDAFSGSKASGEGGSCVSKEQKACERVPSERCRLPRCCFERRRRGRCSSALMQVPILCVWEGGHVDGILVM
jgi:hypothetical protein